MSNKNKAFTLIELLITIAILGIMSYMLIVGYRSSILTQALSTSTESFSDSVKEAYLYSREARDEVEWGIKNANENKYQVVSNTGGVWSPKENGSLENGITFANDFFVVFEIGTGETDSDTTITLVAENGQESQVLISKSGLIDTKRNE